MALHKDVRRQRALEEFRRRLEEMSADEIRSQLARRRIRSEERIAMAEAAIRRHEQQTPRTGAPDTESAASAAAAGAAPETGRPAESAHRGGNGHAAGAAEGRGEAGRAAAASSVPIARQVGRMLGMGLGIASIVALALFVVRR